MIFYINFFSKLKDNLNLYELYRVTLDLWHLVNDFLRIISDNREL